MPRRSGLQIEDKERFTTEMWGGKGVKGFGDPKRDEYKVIYEGQVEKYDLEDIWDRFSRFVRGEEGAHALSISDMVELQLQIL